MAMHRRTKNYARFDRQQIHQASSKNTLMTKSQNNLGAAYNTASAAAGTSV